MLGLRLYLYTVMFTVLVSGIGARVGAGPLPNNQSATSSSMPDPGRTLQELGVGSQPFNFHGPARSPGTGVDSPVESHNPPMQPTSSPGTSSPPMVPLAPHGKVMPQPIPPPVFGPPSQR